MTLVLIDDRYCLSEGAAVNGAVAYMLTMEAELTNRGGLSVVRASKQNLCSAADISRFCLSQSARRVFMVNPLPYNPAVADDLELFSRKKIFDQIFLVFHGLRGVEFRSPLREAKGLKDVAKCVFFQLYKRRLLKRYSDLFEFEKVSAVTVSRYSASCLRELGVTKKALVTYPLPKELPDIEAAEKQYDIVVTGFSRPEKNIKKTLRLIDRNFSGLNIAVIGVDSSDRLSFSNNDYATFAYPDYDAYCKIIRQSKVFLYPSLSEGYGYPPLEAMALGTPVLASPITAIGEISGGGSLIYDQSSEFDLLVKLAGLIDDNELRQEIINMGFCCAHSRRALAEQSWIDFSEKLAQW